MNKKLDSEQLCQSIVSLTVGWQVSFLWSEGKKQAHFVIVFGVTDVDNVTTS